MESTTVTLKNSCSANKKRRASSNTSKWKNKKVKVHNSAPSVNVPQDSAAGRFFLVLELGSALVWDYLSCDDVKRLLHTFSAAFSKEMIDMVLLKAINTFAVENKAHLGCHCECDWMRSLDFVPQPAKACTVGATWNLDMTMPIFQRPNGAQGLLDALILVKKLLQLSTGRGGATYAPLVCPLPIKKGLNQDHVKRAMNRICHGAGKRFFYEFKQKRGHSDADYLDHHWNGMEGSFCRYCDSKPTSGIRLRTFKRLERMRANCAKLYRPLKIAMAENLTFLRFVPRPRHLRRQRWKSASLDPYDGLVAGVTAGGVLCGLYLVKGYSY